MRLAKAEFDPCTVVLAGPPYSGKTTLGLEVSRRTNLNFIDINSERWLFPPEGGEFKKPLERAMAMTETYALAHFRAAEHLTAGQPVLLAATYSFGAYVDMVRRLAVFHGELNGLPKAALKIFVLQAPEESLAERSEARKKMNDEKYFPYIPLERAKVLRRDFASIEGEDIVHINTGLSIQENVAQVLTELKPFQKS